MKINGFAVLLVTETKDYASSNYGISDTGAILEIDTSFFVGGLGPEVLAGNHQLKASTH